MPNPYHPFHPIIYVRGFAATQGEIEDTVADPYMGFNIGSTKSRKAWDGTVQRFYFESPLVRLMAEGYNDVFVEGVDLLMADRPDGDIPYQSIIIYRYYDAASEHFGDGDTPPIEHFARELGTLILRLRDRICANDKNQVTLEQFRAHLVAHSMGGLVCRAFLQNPKLGTAAARGCVDKLFTYATPHNGIDMKIVRNVPGWLSFGDVNNFNRDKMAEYLDLPSSDNVSQIRNFDADRVFNLVGTNSRDYTVMRGLSGWASGDAGDGLVRIENATTYGTNANGELVDSPRGYVNRSHSGHFGIVNSEEGYQNLRRFLFGTLRVNGVLDIDELTLPVELENEKAAGKEVRASYQFEVAVSIRGCQWQMTRQEVRENSAIFRKYDELFPEVDSARAPNRAKSPRLFTVFLDGSKSVKGNKSVSFAVDIKLLAPDYEISGKLFLKRHFEGGYILREQLIVEATPSRDSPGGWRIHYGFQEINPGKPGSVAEVQVKGGILNFSVPLEQKSRPGFKGTLRFAARPWS